MGMLLSSLSEELKYSRERLALFARQLGDLPKGALYRRLIKGRPYWYLEWKAGGKVKNKYIGAHLQADFIERYQKAKEKRKTYRTAIRDLKRQVIILSRAIVSLKRGEEKRGDIAKRRASK